MSIQVVIRLPRPDKKFPMNSFSRGVPAIQFYYRSPSVTKDIEIYQSDMTALLSRHQYICFIQSNGVLSKSHDNFMSVAYLRFKLEIQMLAAMVG